MRIAFYAKSFRVLLLGAVIGWPSLASSLSYPIVEQICVAESGMPRVGKPAAIPVGCRLAGCLESGAYAWQIQVDARMLEGAELRFEGLSARDLKQLQITGSARLEGARIVVGRGESKIDGIPDKVAGKVQVVSLAPVWGTDLWTRLQSLLTVGGQIPGERRRHDDVVDQLTVIQHAGSSEINRYEWRYAITPCRDPVPVRQTRQDTLKIEGGTPGEKLDVVVMIDARKRTSSGMTVCENGPKGDDWVQRFTGVSPLVIPLGDLRSSDGCGSEVAVFSENHRMHLEKLPWTDEEDVHTVTLKPRIIVPVNIWTVDDDDRRRAQDEILVANHLFVKNRVGVEFDPTFRRLSKNEATLIRRQKCKSANAIKKAKRYVAGTLNVYYIAGEGDRNCAIAETPASCDRLHKHATIDGNFTYLGAIGAPFTLAHELGHAFGLRPSVCWGHVNGLDEAFGLENVMYAGTFEALLRRRFTLGQVFRMNTQDDRWGGTMLIKNGLRPEADRRKCLPNERNSICPLLNMDR